MTNATLFVSSVIFTLIHIATILNSDCVSLYSLIILNCYLASIGAHTVFHEYADKWISATLFLVDLFYMMTMENHHAEWLMLFNATIYMFRELCIHYNGSSPFTDLMHICSDVCTTIFHVIILI